MTNTASSTQQTIRISNVCKSYGDYEVLKNVDAEVAPVIGAAHACLRPFIACANLEEADGEV